MLPYQNLVSIDKACQTPIYLQIANSMIQLIQSGVLAQGSKLPGSRKLAELLSIHRKTIIHALEELEAQGWIEIKPYQGTFVSQFLPEIQARHIKSSLKADLPPSHLDLNIPDFLFDQPVPDYRLAFDDGFPDVRLAPVRELATAYGSTLKRLSQQKRLVYEDPRGHIRLRKALSKLLSETRGLRPDPDHIFITRGSQMAIFLASGALIRKGDKVVVGETNYYAANNSFRYFGAELLRVPVDQSGINVQALRKICEKHKIRLIYVTSHHHHPTTVTLSPERRMKLLALASEFNFAILEDDYDYDFHYENNPILPLASIGPEFPVLYIGSFSKSLAPAFRTGFLYGPKYFIKEITRLRRIVDRQGDPVLEQAIAELIENGTIQRTLKKAWKVYTGRKDLFCKKLKEEFSDWINFQLPQGGLAIWATFQSAIHLPTLAKNVQNKGVFLNPGQTYQPPNQQLNTTRMGFGSLNKTELEEALKVLKSEILKLYH